MSAPESSVYHLCAGPQLEDFAYYPSYNDYLIGFQSLRETGKGTRYLYTRFDKSTRVYHYYLRVVNCP